MLNGKTPELVPGTRIVCPKCGKPGVVKIDSFKVKGKEYKYWVVVHTGIRCYLGKYIPESKTPAVSLDSILQQLRGEEKRFYVKPEGPEELQKAVWHVYKVAASWGSLRENPTPENLDMFIKGLERLKEVNGEVVADVVDVLQSLAYYYVKSGDEGVRTRIKGYVNELLRNLLIRVVTSKIPQQPPTGPEIKAKVTKNDSKRGKVYTPVEWVGKTVSVRLVPEQ